MQVCGRRYDTGQAVAIEVRDGRIGSLQPLEPRGSAGDSLPWIAPGFVDLQVNGYGGQGFNDRELTVDKAAAVCRAQDQCGVTAFCPTLLLADSACLLFTARTAKYQVPDCSAGIVVEVALGSDTVLLEFSAVALVP